MVRRPAGMRVLRSLVAAGGLVLALAQQAIALPFEPGEELKLSVSFLSVGIGEVNVSVHEDVDSGVRIWPIRMQAHTHGLAAALYKLDSTLVSKFDPVTGRTVGSESAENAGNVRKTEVIHISGSSASIHRLYNDYASDAVETIPPGAMDIVGAVFSLRDKSLSAATEIRIPVFTGHKNWEMVARVVRHETLSTDAGSFDTIVVQCHTFFDGKYATSGDLTVWLSNDDRRIPVQIEAPFVLGTMRASLATYHAGALARNP